MALRGLDGRSLAVFLLSAFAQGATREVLLRVFHTREFWLQLLLPTLFATLLPIIVWYNRTDGAWGGSSAGRSELSRCYSLTLTPSAFILR